MENYLATCAWRANMPQIYKKSTPAMLPTAAAGRLSQMVPRYHLHHKSDPRR